MMDRREDLEEEFFRHLPRAEPLTIQRELIALPLLVLALLVFLGVLFNLGVLRFPYYQAEAARNRVARITLAPPRGEILDRHGNPLAVNHAIYDCYFITSDDVEADLGDLQALAEFLELASEQLESVVAGLREARAERSPLSELWAAARGAAGRGALGARSLLVKRDLNQVEVTALLERSERFPRAFLERSYRRSYPSGGSAAHVVGYVGEISERELGQWAPLGYRMGDMFGKGGLERQYDNALRGRAGHRLVAVDARGHILGEAVGVPEVLPEGMVALVDGRVVLQPSMVPPTGGSPLRTTLDLDIQRAIDELLGDTVGGVIAMDPRDGSIMAMVSEPGFDPNLFAPGGVDPAGWRAILDDPHFPLLNRPIQSAYVPGSVFKIVTALAAGRAGLLSGGRWTCRGSLEVGDRVFRCWNRGGHGTIGFVTAMAESCDVAFWLMAEELGHDAIADMASILGLDEPTGVDLPSEHGGLIPDDPWKRRRFGERWYLGDTLNMAIGQGFVQHTLLQAASMTACVANGGYLVPPHLNRLLTPAPTTLERIPVDQGTIDAVRAGMRRCVAGSDGTGRGCNLDWIRIAGKTGTADDPPRENPHSWFVSFGPYDSPTLVLVVFCENAGHSDEHAVPLARRIWECDAVRAHLTE